jgi:hypothetical protein
MKKSILLIMAIVFAMQCNAQINSIDYFGQVPPDSTPSKYAPGLISKDGRYELMTTFSADGKEFCFTVTNNKWSSFSIWYTKYDGTKWSEPQVLSFANNGFSPVFSPANNALFYSSGTWPSKSGSIWFCKRNGTHWGQPEMLKEPINLNTGNNNWGFSIAKDSTLLFTSKRADAKGEYDYDLYISEPINNEYKNAINVVNINSSTSEYSAFIAPDKSYIIFSSQRPGNYGWDDLYISFRKKDSSWSNPENLGTGINTVNAEYSPHVTPDGKYLIYSVWDKDSQWSDIYWVRVDNLIDRFKIKLGLTKDKE